MKYQVLFSLAEDSHEYQDVFSDDKRRNNIQSCRLMQSKLAPNGLRVDPILEGLRRPGGGVQPGTHIICKKWWKIIEVYKYISGNLFPGIMYPVRWQL